MPKRGRARPQILIALIAACGFALTLFVFWPGVMTIDAFYVYEAIAGEVGDWQSPVMTALWALVDPVAPGPGSLFLLTAVLYWSGFALIGATLARRTLWLAVIAVLLALMPPAFMFVGIIWRDVLFAAVWLFAAALVFAAAGARLAVRVPAQVAAITLIALGVTLRTNALFAAPILIAYALWPRRFAWKRAALVYLPAVLALYGLVQVVYYDLLGAIRQHPLHSLYVFDLGGITHFTGENQFPVTWSPAEHQRLVTDCYDRLWDVYWHGRRCAFVMGRIENEENIFGTPALSTAWRHALLAHPLAYLRHRFTFMGSFLGGKSFTIWTQDLNDRSKIALPDNRGFVAMLKVHAALKSTPLFRAWLWLVLCVVAFALACRRNLLGGTNLLSSSSAQADGLGCFDVTSPKAGLQDNGCSASAEHDKRSEQGRFGACPTLTENEKARSSADPLAVRVYETPPGAFALAVSGSAIIYVLTYLPFGVALDFRYVYWPVLAALTGGVVVLGAFSSAIDAPQHASWAKIAKKSDPPPPA